MNALQKGVYSILSHYQTTPVYENVPDAQYDAEGNPILGNDGKPLPVARPYITLGPFLYKRIGNKTVDASNISQKILIWSDNGKEEVNTIVNEIIAVLTAWPIDLEADGFNVWSWDFSSFEAFTENAGGYQGTVVFDAKIENLGG